MRSCIINEFSYIINECISCIPCRSKLIKKINQEMQKGVWSGPHDSPIQHIVGEGVNECRPYVHFHLGMSIRRGMEPSVVEWGEFLLRMLQLHGGYLVHHGPRDVATLLDVRTVARQPTQHGKLGQQLGQLVLHVTHDGLYVERLCRRLQVLRQKRAFSVKIFAHF